MRKVIELKILPKYANEVLCVKKTFEVRRNDRDFEFDDIVEFTVVDENGGRVEHLLNGRRYRIGYVLRDFRGLADGYVAFSLFPVELMPEERTKRSINDASTVPPTCHKGLSYKAKAALGILLDEERDFRFPCESCKELSEMIFGDPEMACDFGDCSVVFRILMKEAFSEEVAE